MSQFFNINNTVVIRQIRKANEQNKNPPCRFKASGDWHPWQYFLWYAWIPDQLLKGQVFCKGFGSVDLSQVKLNIKAGGCDRHCMTTVFHKWHFSKYTGVRVKYPRWLVAIPAQSNTAARTNTGS